MFKVNTKLFMYYFVLYGHNKIKKNLILKKSCYFKSVSLTKPNHVPIIQIVINQNHLQIGFGVSSYATLKVIANNCRPSHTYMLQ